MTWYRLGEDSHGKLWLLLTIKKLTWFNNVIGSCAVWILQVFHRGFLTFEGGLWVEFGVSGDDYEQTSWKQTDPRYALSSIFSVKIRPKRGKPCTVNLQQRPKCLLWGLRDSFAIIVNYPVEKERKRFSLLLSTGTSLGCLINNHV